MENTCLHFQVMLNPFSAVVNWFLCKQEPRNTAAMRILGVISTFRTRFFEALPHSSMNGFRMLPCFSRAMVVSRLV